MRLKGLIAVLCVVMSCAATAAEPDALDIGSRRQLFVDRYLFGKDSGVELRLHHPGPREVVLVCDEPWEGNTSGYFTVFRDGDLYRMYYRGSSHDVKTGKSSPQVTCYAESSDGIHWRKPELGICEFNGSTENNIIWTGRGTHNFTPFKDANPECKSRARYKALGRTGGRRGLLAFRSEDGLHWELIREKPVITKGAFDSQNLAFWDSRAGVYRAYFRDFRNGVRAIKTCTSKDFIHWTEPKWLDFGGAPAEHLYTNAVRPYFRAPQILMGFPMRFVPSRNKLGHPVNGVSDGVFMTSRDGLHWHRWLEAFLRPGMQRERWGSRNNMIAWGMVTTRAERVDASKEISIYASENYYAGSGVARLRRHTLRSDGFVSLHAGYEGGELLTRPVKFDGKELTINYSTSAAGSVRVGICTPQGEPIEGLGIDNCPPIYGDSIDEVVEWEGGSDVGALSGKPVRLRFRLQDADIYSFRLR